VQDASNMPTAGAPHMPSLYDYVAWYAEQTPDAEATVHDGRRQSYSELRARVDALARAMLASGVRAGDRVATLAAPNPHYYETFLASVSIGAIWLGLNPRYRLEELCYSSGDARPNLLFASSRIGERSYRSEIQGILERTPDLSRVVLLDDADDDNGEGASPAIVSLSDFLEASGSVTDAALDAAHRAVSGEAPCMIVYTSGSTGKPKGALLRQAGIIAFCEAQVAGWPADPMRVLNFLPINHVGCVVDVTCPVLIAGGCVVFLEDFSPQQSLQLMQDEKITLWGSVPSVFQLQLTEPNFENYDLSAVQMIFWGGAAMPRETIQRLLGFGCPLATNYGMTESGSAITAIPPSRDPDVLADTVGWPFPVSRCAWSKATATLQAVTKWAKSSAARCRTCSATGSDPRLRPTRCLPMAGSPPATWAVAMRTAATASSVASRRCTNPVATTYTRARSRLRSNPTLRWKWRPWSARRTPYGRKWGSPTWWRTRR
jgi:acyl-CoA synthetase (AMP-forming)/AMP-acid ligase II